MTIYVMAIYEESDPINSKQNIVYYRPVSFLKISIRVSSIVASSDGSIHFREYFKNHYFVIASLRG